VIVSDSLGRAWRNGTTGIAIGAAGITAHLSLIGHRDREGVSLRTTTVGLADEIAAAASIVMGQADESCPAVIARGIPYPPGEGRARDLVRPLERDLFR
jgi:coenzyme F420-0:L-glutamate ligase/coenzyme F420-1:gamma-L-glutamate ligase